MMCDWFRHRVKTPLDSKKTLDIFVSGCYKMIQTGFNLELKYSYRVSYKTKRGDWKKRRLYNIVNEIGVVHTLHRIKEGSINLDESEHPFSLPFSYGDLKATSPVGDISLVAGFHHIILPTFFIELEILAKTEEEYYTKLEVLEKYFK